MSEKMKVDTQVRTDGGCVDTGVGENIEVTRLLARVSNFIGAGGSAAAGVEL